MGVGRLPFWVILINKSAFQKKSARALTHTPRHARNVQVSGLISSPCRMSHAPAFRRRHRLPRLTCSPRELSQSSQSHAPSGSPCLPKSCVIVVGPTARRHGRAHPRVEFVGAGGKLSITQLAAWWSPCDLRTEGDLADIPNPAGYVKKVSTGVSTLGSPTGTESNESWMPVQSRTQRAGHQRAPFQQQALPQLALTGHCD